ncbi:phosphoribosylamine--glycine ligase [Endozoicomonas sp. (ex Bugula neritina AB1)]|nr:phosphoribosylamine--glycine ligase [Endozoicomonas sp. (ex Bugula neritina AB1)]
MKLLIIGNGGREHALAWKAAQDDNVTQVFVAPGNAGTASEEKVSNTPISVMDIDGLAAFAAKESIDLTIVGPEAPLVAGVVDQFEAKGLTIFGPSEAAAQLEGSKAFTKDFLARHNIPTAAYQNFTDIEPAKAYVREMGAPIVVKADGLAAGKGVILAQSEQEAFNAIEDMLAGNAFGEAGHRVVIEEFLTGEEASFIVMVDGKNILPLATSQDHKARDNGDKGPNTGGMGAYSPAPVVTQEIHDRVMKEVIIPTVEGMASEGIPYKGFLYAGLMIDSTGVSKVLEYNCRFGDPETQPILMRLKSSLAELCLAGAKGELDAITVNWDNRTALGVVMAAGGYPEAYHKGYEIKGLDQVEHAKVFQAGTQITKGKILTNGGRVLCVTALGETARKAQEQAYKAVKSISWNGSFYRTDIGYRAIARESEH